jgi:hypothetical protein
VIRPPYNMALNQTGHATEVYTRLGAAPAWAGC